MLAIFCMTKKLTGLKWYMRNIAIIRNIESIISFGIWRRRFPKFFNNSCTNPSGHIHPQNILPKIKSDAIMGMNMQVF